MTWLKKIGCRGACRGRTSVVGPPRYSGRASVRTKATTARIWSALSVRSNGGIVGASPCAGPPWVITLTRNSSGRPFIRRPSARSAGRVPNPPADAPSPRPPSPWQVAQWVANRARPVWTVRSFSDAASAAEPQMMKAAPRRANPSAVPPAAQLRHLTPHLPSRPLFADQAEPALQVGVTDGAVHVDHALFEALEEVQVERALVDDVANPHGEPIDERQEVRQRVHRCVHGLADAVADGQRLQEGDDHVGARSHAPEAQRLTEVFAALEDAKDVLGRIEEAADAGRAVDQKATELAAGAQHLALQEAVHESRHERDVVEPVGDHDLDLVRDHEVVPRGDRLE